MEGEHPGKEKMLRVRNISTGRDALKACGLSNGASVLAWIRNTGAPADGTVIFPDMADGKYEVNFYDPWTGVAQNSIATESVGGRLTVSLPQFKRSLALKARRGLIRESR
jgi:hypothetical protein